MAQAATMGPPLSPREIRRSGRRSAPSANSVSKSPDSDLPPRQKETYQRPQSTSNRNKRMKQEDTEDQGDDRKHVTSTTNPTSTNSSNSTKGKRRNREKQRLSTDVSTEAPLEALEEKPGDVAEEEEQGITRCVCGSTGDDETEAGEFMVQCETCKVWQHGLCMGFDSEDQVHDADYYCEQCRPELHGDLLKKLSKKARQPSATSASRVSRSRSPHLLKQPSKRRNTMNSRDAAFDESLKEIIEATAAEAAAQQSAAAAAAAVTISVVQTNNVQQEGEEEVDTGTTNKKKRKRTDDDTTSKKRTRSASTASDHPPPSIPRPPSPPAKVTPQSTAPVIKPPARNKRNSRKTAPVADPPAPLDGDETPTVPTTTKRQSNANRTKGSASAKRPPISHTNSHGSSSMTHEQSTRRGQAGGAGAHGNSTSESSRAYRNSHAYAVSQQPLFTSWGLPDYLAHLEEMLPTNIPQPLEIQSGGSGLAGAGRENVEMTMERGVKVKWPSKRMSVGDMNKRVRALVEWVGREQANALDRERRRDALEKALKQQELDLLAQTSQLAISGEDGVVAMVVDGSGSSQSSGHSRAVVEPEQDHRLTSTGLWKSDDGKPLSTMKMMEELMEELIGFQERFGPGAKARERERRSALTS